MKREVIIELPTDAQPLLERLTEEGCSVEVTPIRRFDGVGILEAVLTLTTASLPFVTKVVLELIRARRHVRIMVDGKEIQGVSERTAERALYQLVSGVEKGPERTTEITGTGKRT